MTTLNPRFFRRKAVLAKVETIYGTDAAPTGAANAIEARNLTLTPLEMDTVENDVIQPYFGNSPEFPVSRRVKLAYDVALQGSGTPGTPPPIGPLLRAVGFAEVINPGSSTDYLLVSEGHEALTQYVYVDGVLHKMMGVRGSVSFAFTPKNLAKARFEFTGLFAPVVDAALVPTTMGAWKTPRAVSNAWTSGFSLFGFETALYDLSLNLSNQVVHRDDIVGAEDVQITDRKPAGKIVIQAPLQADYDFFSAANNVTLGELALTHGTTPGLRLNVGAPKAQIKSPSYGDKNGVTTLEMDLRLNPNAGDDELSLIFD